MQPKTTQRLINFRKSNRRMPRRRSDLTLEMVTFKSPDFLTKFTTETGKILPRRTTGVTAVMHRKITREIKRARAVNLLP